MDPRLLPIVAMLVVGCASHQPPGPVRVLAHRGVHQTFSPDGIDARTCTATRIDPVTHPFLENTLPSIEAAFDAGAHAVEIDVHATADHQLVVLHDETLECRTNGTGRPEEHTLEELRRLDLGYGYTADAGKTSPLRGTGVGLVVSLPEVFEAFPDHAFVVDVKAGQEEVGELVADVLADLPDAVRARQWVYGSPAAVSRVSERLPDVTTFTRPRLEACLMRYLAVGWLGRVPEPCRDTVVLVPLGYHRLLWGFPRTFEARMARHGTEVVLLGPMHGTITTGVDEAHVLERVPRRFTGWIWTNRADRIHCSESTGCTLH